MCVCVCVCAQVCFIFIPCMCISCLNFLCTQHVCAALPILCSRLSDCMMGSSLSVRPHCSVRCPTPGRWNRMHYSCLWGLGFEVSVCIMEAERIRIVMLYGSLVLSLSLRLFFSCSLPLFSFLSLILCLSLFYSTLSSFTLLFFFFCTLALLRRSPTQTTLIHTNTFSSCSLGLSCLCFHLLGVVIDWNRSC